MAEVKNDSFENAWKMYSNKAKRKIMEQYLPNVAKLFSSGNKLQAEQAFNAEMLAALKGMTLNSNELAWAASGELPNATMQDIFDGKDFKGAQAATKTKLKRFLDKARSFFESNQNVYDNAFNYYESLNKFKKEGYTEDEAKMFTIPVDKFKEFNKAIDTKANYRFAGEDNKVHSVSQDFNERQETPKDKEVITGDLVEKRENDKKKLADMFVGSISEQMDDAAKMRYLEQDARDLGFVDADALLDYLVQSYDRSNRIREQEDDGLLTGTAKSLMIPSVNKKWNEGIPASTADWAHDAAYTALELAPQGKAVGLIGKTLKAAAPKVKAVTSVSKVASAPATGYMARKMALPAEAAVVDAVANGDDIDVKDIGAQTIGNMLFDASINSALRGLRYRFSGLPSTGAGSFLQSKKKVAKDLEKRAYEMAVEDEYAKAAHNLMLRSNPDYRASAPIMYKRLSENKIFNNNFNLGQESFDRVFEDAWNTSKHAAATDMIRGKSSLREALKSLDTYKKTRDFKTALEAAAWEKAGLKGNNLLGKLRDNPYKFNIELENAPASKQATLMNIYKDYASLKNKKGLDWLKGQAEYNMEPFLRNYLENLLSVNRIYGRGYGYIKNGAGFKKEKDE